MKKEARKGLLFLLNVFFPYCFRYSLMPDRVGLLHEVLPRCCFRVVSADSADARVRDAGHALAEPALHTVCASVLEVEVPVCNIRVRNSSGNDSRVFRHSNNNMTGTGRNRNSHHRRLTIRRKMLVKVRRR